MLCYCGPCPVVRFFCPRLSRYPCSFFNLLTCLYPDLCLYLFRDRDLCSFPDPRPNLVHRMQRIRPFLWVSRRAFSLVLPAWLRLEPSNCQAYPEFRWNLRFKTFRKICITSNHYSIFKDDWYSIIKKIYSEDGHWSIPRCNFPPKWSASRLSLSWMPRYAEQTSHTRNFCCW